jgi:hypothetical protein
MKRLLLLAALGATTMHGFAAPLSRQDVGSDPALLVHVDADALRSTTVGKAVLADPDVQTKLAAIQAMFSFDFRTQLHGFTIYTTMTHSDDPVLIIYADFEPDRLITLARAFPGFRTDTNGDHTIYNWVDEKKKSSDGTARVYASLAGRRLMFGKTEPALLAALDVIDGKSPAFSGSKLLLEAAPGELVVAQGRALKFSMDDNNPSAAIFQASKSVRVQLGEAGDNVAAKVSFEAKDEDSASQISAMVNGLLALLRFQKDNPDLLKLANGINVRQDGVAVILSLSAPSADIIQILKKGAADEHRKEEQQHLDDTNAPATKT